MLQSSKKAVETKLTKPFPGLQCLNLLLLLALLGLRAPQVLAELVERFRIAPPCTSSRPRWSAPCALAPATAQIWSLRHEIKPIPILLLPEVKEIVLDDAAQTIGFHFKPRPGWVGEYTAVPRQLSDRRFKNALGLLLSRHLLEFQQPVMLSLEVLQPEFQGNRSMCHFLPVST